MTVYRWHFPWMLVAKIRKKYVTSLHVTNPAVASESANIENYIERRNLREKINRMMYGGNGNDYYDSSSMRYRVREKGIKKEVRKELMGQ